MIVIGIDASTTCTGYGVFEDNKLIDYGCIRPEGDSWRERLINEGPEFKDLLIKYRPDKIYMENVPLMGKQMQTLVILGAVQGFFIGITSSLNIPVEFLLPSQWRSIMGLYDGTKTGTKKEAMKEKAVKMANDLFGLSLTWIGGKSKKNQDDIAEGILIAYSQIRTSRIGIKRPSSQ